METKSLLNYKSPNYPRIEVVFSKPDILLKNMPKSWQGNKLIIAAMITFSFAACKSQTDNKINKVKIEQIQNDISSKEETSQIKQNTNKVAPIFVHGEGVGVSGCVMIAPPVYLSEEEALKIILSELKKEGLSFKDKYIGEPMQIERKKIIFKNDKKITKYEERYTDTTEIKNIKPDVFNKELNMAIEFVSIDDYIMLCDDNIEMSSVSSFRIKDVAEKIQNAFSKNKELNSVVFYDPVGLADEKDFNKDWDEMEELGKDKAIKMLKQQVDDFIEWLKKEKINFNK